MMEMARNMTPAQAKEMMDKLSPEEREQAAKMQENMRREMQDMQHVAMKLAPTEADPDAEVTLFKVITTLATAPLMAKLGETADEGVLDKLEELLVGVDGLEAGQLNAFLDVNRPVIRRNVLLLNLATSTEAELLTKLKEIVTEANLLQASDVDAIEDKSQRRNAMLQKLSEKPEAGEIQTKLEALAVETKVMEEGRLTRPRRPRCGRCAATSCCSTGTSTARATKLSSRASRTGRLRRSRRSAASPTSSPPRCSCARRC